MTDPIPEAAWVPDAEWAAVVRHAPVVSVDLVVRAAGGVVLARRTNEPARGEWFVPGGRVLKNERLADAVGRLARGELGVDVDVVEELGAYEHFYEASDVPDSNGKHYVAFGYVVDPESESFDLDGQHSAVRTFAELPADTHEYTAAYVRDAETVAVPVADG